MDEVVPNMGSILFVHTVMGLELSRTFMHEQSTVRVGILPRRESERSWVRDHFCAAKRNWRCDYLHSRKRQSLACTTTPLAPSSKMVPIASLTIVKKLNMRAVKQSQFERKETMFSTAGIALGLTLILSGMYQAISSGIPQNNALLILPGTFVFFLSLTWKLSDPWKEPQIEVQKTTTSAHSSIDKVTFIHGENRWKMLTGLWFWLLLLPLG